MNGLKISNSLETVPKTSLFTLDVNVYSKHDSKVDSNTSNMKRNLKYYIPITIQKIYFDKISRVR